MNKRLPRLRLGLDIMPSPVSERPGLLFRDPFRYTEEMLIIPPLLSAGLGFFDGESTGLDLQAHLSKLAGQLIPSEVIQSLIDAMQQHEFLEGEQFEELRAPREAQFAAASIRRPAHAGSGYPDQMDELRTKFDQYLEGSTPAAKPIIGLAAPHVSPWGGWQSYGAAYGL